MKTEQGIKNCILNAESIKRRLRRMAFQIAESNSGESSIVIAGIANNGIVVASNLVDELKRIMDINIEFATIHLNKRQPMDVRVEGLEDFNNKVVIVVDDVANSGRTLLYALKPFLNFSPRKIQTLVLVERSHKTFPVFSDFVGLSLSTTLQDHIVVETAGNVIMGAWLE